MAKSEYFPNCYLPSFVLFRRINRPFLLIKTCFPWWDYMEKDFMSQEDFGSKIVVRLPNRHVIVDRFGCIIEKSVHLFYFPTMKAI